ncbi:hypothetical protein [Alicyclobacillus acidocaldarius]|nr:hypothetical protein [Alicyclobacillus acidocaldarius]
MRRTDDKRHLLAKVQQVAFYLSPSLRAEWLAQASQFRPAPWRIDA